MMPVKEVGPDFQFASWHIPQFPRAIEYPLEVMEEIRALACEELLQLSHGGDEVGGVLFGTRREDLVRILTWRPIACEHLDGPALRLSYNDRMNLAVQLEVARQNPDLKDLRPLGCFISRLSGDVALTASDLEIYNGFFPEAWQIALLICPRGNGRAEAGFFVREPDGKLQTESSYYSFALNPLRSANELPGEATASASAEVTDLLPTEAADPIPFESEPEHAMPLQSEATQPVLPQPEPPAPPVASQPEGGDSVPPPSVRVVKLEEANISESSELTTENLREPTPPAVANLSAKSESIKTPRATNAPVQHSRTGPVPLLPVDAPTFELDEQVPTRERWLWMVPILLALGIAAFMLYQRRTPSGNTSIALQATSEGQNVELTWNAASRAIRDAFRGEVDIVDGSKSSHIALTADQLHSGRLTYLPQSGDVDFVITVYPTSGDAVHDATRFIAPAINGSPQPALRSRAAETTPAPPARVTPATSPTPASDRDALERQVQELKTELAKERAHANELQNLVRILENRLGIEESDRSGARRH